MSTAAILGKLLGTTSEINHYTMQQIYWSDKYKANQQKLNRYQKYEEAYNKAYDNAKDETRSSDLKMGENIYIKKNTAASDAEAEAWAMYKAPNFDADKLAELEELDLEYDTMKTMIDTLLEELRAEEENEKQQASTEAQNTHLLGQ